VEQDGVLVALDLALHRLPAYRHVLYNRSSTANLSVASLWQITAALVALDVYLMRQCQLTDLAALLLSPAEELQIALRLLLAAVGDHACYAASVAVVAALRAPAAVTAPAAKHKLYLAVLLPQAFKLGAAFVLIWDQNSAVVSTVRLLVASMQYIAVSAVTGSSVAAQCIAAALAGRLLIRCVLAALGVRSLL
jgi:Arv1-like family